VQAQGRGMGFGIFGGWEELRGREDEGVELRVIEKGRLK